MMERSDRERAIFAKCSDPARIARLWERILGMAAQTGREGPAQLDALLIRYLSPLPNPERALLHFDRFLETSLSAATVVRDILRTPRYLEMFCNIVSTSSFLADVLVRDAQVFRYMVSSGVLYERHSREEYTRIAREAMDSFNDAERRLNALRRFHRRETLYIAASDIMGIRDLEAVTRALSDLADTVVQLVLDYAIDAASERLGVRISMPFSIIALGKLGGRELNYSSDIDVMVLYSDDRKEGDAVSAFDAAAKVVELMVQAMTKTTNEGFLYRTDLRLRPDGGAGAPAHSVQAALTYYESRGTMWERQMLMKARHCAGSEEAADRFFEGIVPYLYPRTMAAPPGAILEDVRRRLALRTPRPDNVKHMPGGIRYVEFSVQALQVIHAARMKDLRTPTTLEVCGALERVRLLTADEASALRTAYVFFRRVEHMLQLERFEQTHELPSTESELEELAWKMRFPSWDKLYTRIEELKRGVMETFYNIFAPRQMEREPPALVTAEQYSLSALGFYNVSAAQKALRMFLEGRRHNPHPLTLRKRIEETIGPLLADISREPDADLCLQSLEAMLNTTPSRETFLSFLSSGVPRAMLLRLASLAPGTLRTIAPHADVLEAVFSGLDPDPEETTLAFLKMVHQTKNLGIYLLGEQGFKEYSEYETATADRCVAHVYNEVLAPVGVPFLVVALGKYGGGELNPGSDLDLYLIHEPVDGVSQESIITAAMEFESQLRTAAGYAVDTRVRPEGSKGQASTSFEGFRQYFAGRAAVWERQAMMKLRIVEGDERLAKRFSMFVDEQRASLEFSPDVMADIAAVRRRSEPEVRRGSSAFDIKRSPGGLMDAEYAVQAAQLALVQSDPRAKERNTFAALDVLPELLPELEFRFLRLQRHYLFFRKIQLAMRLLFERTSNNLPTSTVQLNQLAISVGSGTTDAFRNELSAAQKETREDMLAVFERLRGNAETAKKI